MKQNMGSIDRIVRTVISLILLALALTGTITGVVSTIAIIIAVVFLATALFSWCPIYAVLKLSTKKA